MKKFLIWILAVVLCFGMVGCKKGNGTDTPPDGDDPGNSVVTPGGTTDKPFAPDESTRYEGGTHIRNMTVREGEYLVRDGKTEYKIVYPAAATDNENLAVSELQTYFEAATGIVLSTVPDTGLTYAADAKYISVGATTVLDGAEIEFDETLLKQTGVRVVTKGNTIFLAGAHDYGTLYAAYEFLSYAFDWEVFADNVITYNAVTDVPLMQYDVTEVPDFEFNVAGHLSVRNNVDLRNRFRMIQLQDQTVTKNDNIYHDSLDWLPGATYAKAHPDWYSTRGYSSAIGGGNLCYNARGNAAELEEMKNTLVELMKERIKAFPNKKYISFSITDTRTTICDCKACTDMAKAYGGTQSAAVVKFLNDVRARLQVWFDSADGKQYYNGQKILFLAYHATNAPPVNYDEATKQYTPIDESVVCKDIVPWFAETDGDYTCSLLENESVNGVIARNMEGWGALADEILFWTYGTNFTYYLAPYNSFDGFAETYRFAAQNQIKALYAQHQSNNDMSTGWERLKAYLNYKLGWDVNADVGALTDRFFKAYFGPAAGEMQDVFNEYRALAQKQIELGYAGSRSEFHNALQAKYWPRNLLLDWTENFDRAMAAIEPLKETDSTLYDAYYYNIALERVSPYYLIVMLYESTFSTQTVSAFKQQVKADCEHTGISLYAERNGELSRLWSSWGI